MKRRNVKMILADRHQKGLCRTCSGCGADLCGEVMSSLDATTLCLQCHRDAMTLAERAIREKWEAK
jgi:hypothetical protein